MMAIRELEDIDNPRSDAYLYICSIKKGSQGSLFLSLIR